MIQRAGSLGLVQDLVKKDFKLIDQPRPVSYCLEPLNYINVYPAQDVFCD